MGEGTIEGCHLFGLKPDIDKTLAIVALNEESDWVGLIQIGSEDIGKKVEIPLQMGCRVKGSLTSKGLEKLGQPLSWTNVYVYWEESRFISCSSENQRFEFLLPPGEYRIQAYGTGTEFFEEKIQILPGQKQMELEYDLPVDTIAALKGKKPPEFKDIKGWKNGDAIKLSDLQGKVVLVDFWGYWCSPCLAEMPKLIELHDKYSKEGLVIIGVHDDSLKSMSELDEKLIQIKDKHLVGRNIPFLIALDGGGRKAIKGTSRTTQGATTAAYGIYSFPTTILIDKQGQLFDRFNVDSATDVRKLEVLLGIAEDSHRIST